MQKTFTSPLLLKDLAKDGRDTGEFEAVFSTFDEVDLDGDIVRRSAIKDGQSLPILWGHDAYSMPVATGVVKTTETQAIIEGKFIDSSSGKDALATVRATKDMQELSWGFVVTESKEIQEDGRTTGREITGTSPLEVSFVLRGAGKTGVLGIKGHTSLAEQIGHTRVAVQATVDRAKAVARMRFDNGETLGPRSAVALADLAKDFKELDELIEGLSKTEKGDGTPTATAEQLRAKLVIAENKYLLTGD